MRGTKPVLDPPRRAVFARRRRAAAIRKVFFGVFAVLVIALAALCGYLRTTPMGLLQLISDGAGLIKDTHFHTPPFHGKTHVNILVLGTDVNFVDQGIPRSDTIKLVSIDTRKPSIAILSVPRDTWIELPNGRMGKINGAYQLGGEDEMARIASARSAITGLIEEYYGQPVPVDYFVRIQTGGFRRIVDAIGGVEIDVEKQMDYEDNYQNLYIHLKPGRQLLDGTQAMGYVRFRHDWEGDYGRMRRQDQFIRALAAQLNKPETKRRLPALFSAIRNREFMLTDLRLNDMREIKRIASILGMESVHTIQLPTVPDTRGAASVVVVDDPEAARLAIGEVLNGPRPTVLVLNGSGRRDLARDVSDTIDANAYNVVGVGSLETPEETTRILATPRNRTVALSLASQFGLAEVDTETAPPKGIYPKRTPPPPPSEITLVLGKDYAASDGQQVSSTQP